MKIGAYDVYRKDGICILREEKAYETNSDTCTIRSDKDLFKLCTDTFNMDKLTFERMLLICVDNKHIPRAIFEIGNGAHDYCIASESTIFTKILLSGCNRFFMAHNHPSTISTPSEDDIKFTKKIEKAAKILNIGLLDHMIIGKNYYSFKEAGILK